MTMNFNRKTCMRLAAGTVLCGGAAFGGLLWWQLQAFDQMTDSRLERAMGLFALELERRDGGLLQRDLVLRLGFRTEAALSLKNSPPIPFEISITISLVTKRS